MKALRFLIFLWLLVPAIGPRAQNLPDLGDTAQSDLSPQAERRIGESIMREIRRDPDYVGDPEIRGYVQSLGQRLVAASKETKQAFEFFVVRDPTVNAFAMPGGFIGVHTGLLLTAESESELASVMSHEIAHVTQRHIARQLQAQNQLSIASMAGMALAILAARASPGAAQAAIIASQAAPIQASLYYSRDFEREADRIGFQTLQASGYDVQGMPTFFERLQKATRMYDNNAPVYLRSHPLTTERIADMQNRAEGAPYRQRADSSEFQLVRAKLRSEAGTPAEAVAFFRATLAERRFIDERAVRYGYAAALLRAGDARAAEAELAVFRRAPSTEPMFETLAARVRMALGDKTGALAILAAARTNFPENLAVLYEYVETLQALGRQSEAIDLLNVVVKRSREEPEVYKLLAKSYSALGQRVPQHRALAELYHLQGSLSGAIEQLQFAQTSGEGDFYTLSAVDARLREFRAEQAEELKQKRR